MDLVAVGHIGQNVHLQAEALGLGTVVLGAFKSEVLEAVKRLMEVKGQELTYIMPVGRKVLDQDALRAQ